FLCLPPGRGRHVDELIDEGAQVLAHAEEHERGRLVLDRFESLQRLRVFIAEVREVFARFLGSGIVGRHGRFILPRVARRVGARSSAPAATAVPGALLRAPYFCVSARKSSMLRATPDRTT